MGFTHINIGTIPNDGTGNPLRDGGQIINDNFDLILSTDKNVAVTSEWTFVVAKEKMLFNIFASHGVGSVADYTIKAGTTLHGDDLLNYFIGEVPLSGGIQSFFINRQLSWTADITVYVEISGAGAVADIRPQLILNS